MASDPRRGRIVSVFASTKGRQGMLEWNVRLLTLLVVLATAADEVLSTAWNWNW